ncbi:MAG: fibronectin type III domain-containing protein, partial [Ruminococcus sp.]|nr:fibronectin type III domain-containing protein [Ruminococcus sp.]
EETQPVAKTTTHTFSDWDTTTPATCKDEGVQTRTCSVCGKEETQPVAKTTTHTFSDWDTTTPATCKDEGVQTRTCSVCGKEETQPVAKTTTHTFSDWNTTTPATCKDEGVQTRTCSVCGKEETQPIDKTAHSYTSKTIAPTYSAHGYTLYTCSVCKYSYKGDIKAKLSRQSIKNAKVNTIADQVYTGKALSPKNTVKLNGKTLRLGTDYTVEYKNNKNPGVATVTIKGKGEYTGSVVKKFKIVLEGTKLKTVKSKTTGQFKATWTKTTKPVSGYQISYSTSQKFAKSKTKKSTKTSITINKLNKNKTYYVRVRTYKKVGNKIYYSKWSNVKKVKIKK